MIIAYPYYNSGQELETIIDHYNSFKPNFKMIVVDDGSEDKAIDHIKPHKFDIDLYRINEDIYNNCSGANNLLFSAAEGNVLKMDIDFMVSEETLNGIKELNPYRASYLFHCNGNHHPNTFYINRDLFWEAGGYDEDFSGGKGYGDVILHHVFKKWGIFDNDKRFELIPISAPSCNIRHTSEKNKELYQDKVELIRKGEYRNGKILRFTYLKEPKNNEFFIGGIMKKERPKLNVKECAKEIKNLKWIPCIYIMNVTVDAIPKGNIVGIVHNEIPEGWMLISNSKGTITKKLWIKAHEKIFEELKKMFKKYGHIKTRLDEYKINHYSWDDKFTKVVKFDSTITGIVNYKGKLFVTTENAIYKMKHSKL